MKDTVPLVKNLAFSLDCELHWWVYARVNLLELWVSAKLIIGLSSGPRSFHISCIRSLPKCSIEGRFVKFGVCPRVTGVEIVEILGSLEVFDCFVPPQSFTYRSITCQPQQFQSVTVTDSWSLLTRWSSRGQHHHGFSLSARQAHTGHSHLVERWVEELACCTWGLSTLKVAEDRVVILSWLWCEI